MQGMPSPLLGSPIVATARFAIAVLSLIPAGNAMFARKLAFPLGTLAGLALAGPGLQASKMKFGLSQGMVLAASGDTPGMKIK